MIDGCITPTGSNAIRHQFMGEDSDDTILFLNLFNTITGIASFLSIFGWWTGKDSSCADYPTLTTAIIWAVIGIIYLSSWCRCRPPELGFVIKHTLIANLMYIVVFFIQLSIDKPTLECPDIEQNWPFYTATVGLIFVILLMGCWCLLACTTWTEKQDWYQKTRNLPPPRVTYHSFATDTTRGDGSDDAFQQYQPQQDHTTYQTNTKMESRGATFNSDGTIRSYAGWYNSMDPY